MCGIVGFNRLNQTGSEARAIVGKMADSLKYRGPDDEGFFVGDSVVLGHRRLSIIDLSSGRQPITNEDGSVVLVFNGEIYNFKELRKELESKGHRFSTNTDTETIVHLYEEKGKDFVKWLNGIFAFALFDVKNNKLFLARDRLGVKPLHYLFSKRNLIFGSEIKSILMHPEADRGIDNLSLAKYLVYEFIPAPNSIYRQIKKVLPANIMEFDLRNNSLKSQRYWRPNFTDKLNNINEDEASELLLSTLRKVVRKEIISDVPIGLFLSGGIDSSALAFLMSEIGNVSSFCIGFNEKSFDESKYAFRVAKHLGIDHFEQILDCRDAFKILPEILNFMDEPMADPSIIPTYLLSKFAKKRITVALGGDGGDELFAGYDTYQAHRIAKYYKLFPKKVRDFIGYSIDRLPVSTANLSLDFKLKKFKEGINQSPAIMNALWLGAFADYEIPGLLSGSISIGNGQIFEELRTYDLEANDINDPIERLQYFDLRFFLQDKILVKVDRASMLNSLEVRVPFLNHEVVDFVARLPSKLKLNGFKTKYILKKALEDKVPNEILRRNKKGFGIPVAEWINAELKDLVLAQLDSKKIKKEGFFNPDYTDRLLKEHFMSKKDNKKKIWTLLIFELWLERHITN